MKIIKKISLFILLIVTLLASAFYFYIQSLPTSPPDFVDSREINPQQSSTPFQCNTSKNFEHAYQVNVNIDSVLNGQIIYQSNLQFNTQFKQLNGALIKGISSNIKVKEAAEKTPNSIKDVYFLSRAKASPHIVFTAFNDLGLPEKHPMKIIAQLFKGLSVGQENENYHFAYDSMQRTYRYQHHGKRINRISQSTTANLSQFSNTLQNSAANILWQVELDDNCLPLSLISEEQQGLSIAGHSGHIKFHILAKKIPLFTQLDHIELNNYSNSQNHWSTKTIATTQFESNVDNGEQMWSIFNGFEKSKNTAQLVKAADYLINNMSIQELTDYLLDPELESSLKRDISFALSLSNHELVESYIIDTLTALNDAGKSQAGLTAQQHGLIELQQVRLMVSLSTSSQVSEQGFQALATLANDSEQNANIRNNALINLASSLRQINKQGPGNDYLQQQLTEELNQALEGEQAASAILAVGNSDIATLNLKIIEKLNSSNNKERYAAATVLARDSHYHDDLIQHLTTEQSDLVSYTILTNIDQNQLTQEQKQQLRELTNTASPNIRQVINQMSL